MICKLENISMKYIAPLGTLWGLIVSWFDNHWDELITTIVLAALGTFVSGFMKYFVDNLNRKMRRRRREKDLFDEEHIFK